MTRLRKLLFVLVACLPFVGGGYYLGYRYYLQPFSCQASLVQHHPGENVSLWLRYTFDGKRGTLSMNGSIKSDPNKSINRKIMFRIKRMDNLFLLTAEQNIKFPNNNVDDAWLEKYEPNFFIYPGKSIYIRINEQQNGNYLFSFGTLPTYVCRSSKNE